MNINSNRYTFIYAVILVVIVAIILSVAATVLAPKQEENIKIEKMQNILRAAMTDVQTAIDPKNVVAFYDRYITQEITINSSNGKVINIFDVKTNTLVQGIGQRAFDIDVKTQYESLQQDKEAQLPVFVYENNGQKKFVIPLRGIGLWGAIWGNMAFSEDFQFIQGVVFDHKSETPGLGADITTNAFTSQFRQKTIFNEEGEVQFFKVIKGGIAKAPKAEHSHSVDALSGATLTSEGVQNMINNFISYYKPWMLNVIQENKIQHNTGIEQYPTNENDMLYE